MAAPAWRSETVSASLFALPRLATSFVATGIVTLAVPQMVVLAVGEARKGLHLGSISAAASIASLAALYLSGMHSDRRRLDGGRRHLPVVWLAVMALPLAALASGSSYPAAIAAIMALVVTRSLCDAAHLPIIADDFHGGLAGEPGVPRPGVLSAHIAFQQFLGAALGALAFAWLPVTGGGPAGLRTASAAVAIALLVLAAAGFLLSFRRLPRLALGTRGAREAEPAPSSSGQRGVRTGSAHDGSADGAVITPNLRALLAARTLFMAGVFIISTFLVFLVRDVLAAPDVERVTAILVGGTLSGALLSALPAGRLASTFGDRRVLFAAGAAVAAVAPAFLAFAPGRPAFALLCMLLYGLAFGTVVTSGLSLTLAVVVDPSNAGRSMALASATTFLAQSIASGAGAVVLDPLNRLRPNAGYAGLVALIELLLAGGGYFLTRVDVPAPARRRPA